MLRRLFTLTSDVSLLLCAVMLVLWVRSYWRADAVYLSRHHWFISIEPADGHILLRHEQAALGWDFGSHFDCYSGGSPEDREFNWPG